MILVTGAGGWLGSELTKQLLRRGKNVRALNNIETIALKTLKKTYGEKLDIVVGDICNQECIEKSMIGIDIVFHLAAKVHYVPTNQEEEKAFYNVNTDATEKIFKECLKKNISRIIFFSSVSVYEISNNVVDINSKKSPNTVYGNSKLKAENIGNKMYKEDGLPITIIEPVTVYGEGDVGNFRKLEKLINKRICIRFGNGENKKTVIYYKDLIKMVINISEDNNAIGKTFICGTEVLTINKINDILQKKTNKMCLKIYIPEWLFKFIKKICLILRLKKIERKIIALTQNNEFDIGVRDKYLDKYKKFEEFENEK